MELSKDIRISYLRDPYNADRVMTVVSKRDATGENLSFAVAINHPTEWKTSHEFKGFVAEKRVKGDAFSKRKGLMIALGRLADKPTLVSLNGRAPRVAILDALMNDKNSIVKRIALAELDYLATVETIDYLRKAIAESGDIDA